MATRLEADDADPQDGFGQSIALASESVALVGTFSQSPDHNAVYLVRRSGGDWSTLALLLDAEGRRSDEFAVSVALDGSSAVAGGSGKNTLTGTVLGFELSDLVGYPLFADGFATGTRRGGRRQSTERFLVDRLDRSRTHTATSCRVNANLLAPSR